VDSVIRGILSSLVLNVAFTRRDFNMYTVHSTTLMPLRIASSAVCSVVLWGSKPDRLTDASTAVLYATENQFTAMNAAGADVRFLKKSMAARM
jgi:hypothetical protein